MRGGRCSTCGKRLPEIRSRCDHVRTYRRDGELIGRITWAPRSPEDDQPWKVEHYEGRAAWWRSDDLEDAEYDLLVEPWERAS